GARAKHRGVLATRTLTRRKCGPPKMEWVRRGRAVSHDRDDTRCRVCILSWVPYPDRAMPLTLTVPNDLANERLDKALAKLASDAGTALSRNKAKALID